MTGPSLDAIATAFSPIQATSTALTAPATKHGSAENVNTEEPRASFNGLKHMRQT
jgi:hypothetical protein